MTLSWSVAAPTLSLPRRVILLVEDNETLALGLRSSLEVEGYEVYSAGDGEEAIAWLASHRADLVILDLMLPKMSGFEVLRRLRSQGSAAVVLVLSARDQEVDKVQGFRLGADDYVVKPVGVLELLARVEAMLRRAGALAVPARRNGRSPVSVFGDVTVDFRTRTVSRGGAPVELSPMEFDLLAYLMDAAGAIVSRETLMRQVWRYSDGVATRTVDQHVARLRHKLEADPAEPRHLLTVRKAGYRFEP